MSPSVESKAPSSPKHIESQSLADSSSDDVARQHKEYLERQAVRKLDVTVLPVMAMFYLLSFLDRANIGNARVAGLQKDLGLTDTQYQICVTVLFVPYICAELPSNLLLRRVGPKLLMPTLLTIWGVMVTLQGLVTNYAGLVVLRAFLGLVEGPMFPGIVLYLSGFYTRAELSLRLALFFSTASLSGAFSGLLAAAIEQMDGLGNKPGWAWIFIIEGLFSVCIGLVGFFVVPSTPRDSKFLTHEQKELIMARLEADRPSIRPSDKFSIGEIIKSVTSPHVLVVFVIFFMIGANLYGLALFIPSIIKQLGFDANKTQLLSVGPFAGGFFVTVFSAMLSDKYHSRGVTNAIISLLAVAGYALYLGGSGKHTAYAALYLIVPGVYATPPVVAAWMANNSEPYYRRATSVAFGFIATNSGGILSTWRFPSKEGPKYRNTTIMGLIFSILIVVFSLMNTAYLTWLNKQRSSPEYRERVLGKYLAQSKEVQEKGEQEKGQKEKEEDGGLEAWMELGDKHPDFRYTV